MKRIRIYGARTGNGHISVLNAIQASFAHLPCKFETFPTFYEEVAESNRIISDFYNLIQQRSTELCSILSDIMVTEGNQQRERLYGLYAAYLDKAFDDDIDAIISVTPLINYPLIRYINERRLHTYYYIVVTDPYRPMYPGFDVAGARRYFCPNRLVEAQLLEKGIDQGCLSIIGYPLHYKFFNVTKSKEVLRQENRITLPWVVLINCGANGNMRFYKMIRSIIDQTTADCHFIVVCGNNSALYRILDNCLDKERVSLFGFVNHLEELLTIADVCITKPGANAIYEALATNTLPLVVSFDGMVYQERGVYAFLEKEYDLDIRLDHLQDIIDFLNYNLSGEIIKQRMNTVNRKKPLNGSDAIARIIVDDLQCGYEGGLICTGRALY